MRKFLLVFIIFLLGMPSFAAKIPHDVKKILDDSFSSKESLSIIPQGKISEILGGNSFEKRGIIEESIHYMFCIFFLTPIIPLHL